MFHDVQGGECLQRSVGRGILPGRVCDSTDPLDITLCRKFVVNLRYGRSGQRFLLCRSASVGRIIRPPSETFTLLNVRKYSGNLQTCVGAFPRPPDYGNSETTRKADRAGAMVSGYPSDATDNAVQAAVVAAGYR